MSVETKYIKIKTKGDTDIIDIQDLTYIINYVFYGGASITPFVDQGDLNFDGIVDIGDVNYMISYLFYQGPPIYDRERFLPVQYFDMFYRPSITGKNNWAF